MTTLISLLDHLYEGDVVDLLLALVEGMTADLVVEFDIDDGDRAGVTV